MDSYEMVACSPYRSQIKKSPLHLIDPKLREREPRWYADRYYLVKAAPYVDIIFLDTSVFVQEYYNQSWAYDVEGGLSTQDPDAQLAFLREALQNSTANWKIVVGHHPLYSRGFSGGYADMRDALEPLFQEYNVTAYLNGHDHSLQHLNQNGIHYFVSGGGSLTHSGFPGSTPTLFEYDRPGFAAYAFTPENMIVYFFDDNANAIYNRTIALK